MSDTRYTPGPWTADRLLDGDKYGYVWGPEMFNGICRVDDQTDQITTQANADLIAAAPDLYAALQAADQALDECQCVDPDCASCDRAEAVRAGIVAAALAKAEGRARASRQARPSAPQ